MAGIKIGANLFGNQSNSAWRSSAVQIGREASKPLIADFLIRAEGMYRLGSGSIL
ncbi:MAG: hypothetical protein R3F11_02285 [Verrucomicrobiales bacterium]